MDTVTITFALLRSALHGTLLDEATKNEITQNTFGEIYKLSKKHDVLHLVIHALEINGVRFEPQVQEMLTDKLHLAVFRVEQIEYELAQVRMLFQGERIDYVPLKGAVIRKYYPEPWFRTCCDIDVLVREEQLERAVSLLCDTLGYTHCGKAYHDVSLLSPSGVHLELHFNILEKLENIDGVLSSVWENVEQQENGYEYQMTNEFLLFHVLAHSSYHFLCGGCGIRPILDLYLMERDMPYQKEKVEKLVQKCGLTKYREGLLALGRAWFDGEPLNEKWEDMQAYILGGGVYGNMQNRMVLAHAKVGGKGRYFLRRVFMPYNDLKEVYPSLKGKKWLTPFYQIRRWGKVFFGGRLKKSVKEAKVSAAVDQEEKQRMQVMMQQLGLL